MIANTFLKLSRGTLFALLIAPTIIGAIMPFEVAVRNAGALNILSVINMMILLAWFYSIGSAFYAKINEKSILNFRLFQVNCLFPLIVTPIILLLGKSINSHPWIFFLLLVYAFFALFYCLRFAAKSIAVFERGMDSHFGVYAGDFFLMWFFPIGVWFVQPKVQKLLNIKGSGLTSRSS